MTDLSTTKTQLSKCIDTIDREMKSGHIKYDDWVSVRAAIGAVYNAILGLSSELLETLTGENQMLVLELVEQANVFIDATLSDLGDSQAGKGEGNEYTV